MTTILCIDPDPDTVRLVRDATENMSCLIETSTSIDTINELMRGPVDVVLVDISAEASPGRRFLTLLCEEYREVPIIVMFKSSTTDLLIEALRRGAFEFLMKPLTRENIERVIERVLGMLELKKQKDSLRNELLETNRQLRELSYFKDQVSSQIVHDLRNKMAIFTSALDILFLKVVSTLPASIREELDSLKKSVERLTMMIDEVTTLFNIQSPDYIMQWEKTDIESIIHDACQLMKPLANKLDIMLSKNIRRNIFCLVDRRKLHRIIENLLMNGLVFTPAKGQVMVHLDQENIDDQLFFRIDVIDTGVGIPRDDIHNIFKMFYRVRGSSPHGIEGPGIGLSIVKSLVSNHRGKIKVTSRPGDGSMFSILLPILNSVP